ncbi:MAG TPA: sugar transferase [Candidatus Dormibacteraeota bacterium]
MAAKRGIDVAIALVGLLLAAPVLLLVAIAIKVDSPGPVLYRGRRLGRGGKHFTMHKLRTMHVGAHDRLAEIIHLNVGEGMVKIPDDPRQTAVGRLLRRLSIDEVPQLWDVLRGEMSLVGPRPHVPGELNEDDPLLMARLVMRPGMTGLWQVSARTHPALERRVQCDLDYINRWSLVHDFTLLARTVPAVLRADGGATLRPLARVQIGESIAPVVKLAPEPARIEKLSLS